MMTCGNGHLMSNHDRSRGHCAACGSREVKGTPEMDHIVSIHTTSGWGWQCPNCFSKYDVNAKPAACPNCGFE